MDSYQHPWPPPPPPQPPSSIPPDHHQHHQHPPPPPPQGSWYSGQFQYHPPQSPSPPPPQQPPQPPPPHQHHNQWAPPPPPPHYHAHHPNNPYPAPQHFPPPPPRPAPYPHQDWGTANHSHHPGWEFPGQSNEEDWAAKARAWASARSAMENQHPQSQYSSMARQEEPSHYSNQYSQPVAPHYQDVQQPSGQISGFQNYQAPVAPLARPPAVHQQDPASISPYATDGHFSFAAKDGSLGGDMGAALPHHQGTSSSSVNQQEVPSSYSSIPGKEEGAEGRHHVFPLLPADGRPVQMEQAQFAYGKHSFNPMDQPLDFAPRYGHENDSKLNSGYSDSSVPGKETDSVGAMSSLHAWTTPIAPGITYRPVTPAFPSAPQHDPSIGVPPIPGHPAPMLGSGSSFQSEVPSITAPVALAAGMALHPTTAFPVDAYGTSVGSDRPKKAAVPNWLREEIIKKKATITNSVPEHFKEGSPSMEDELIDRSTGKGDLADIKSMDSSRSTEEEDDDEDYEEAQRMAAINQEIKRVLTEVLLKVTDELFDEIATKVLNEDDLVTDAMAEPDSRVSNHKASPPSASVPAPKASAKVLVPVEVKKSEADNASGESSSGSPGNVLGLANYSSDDDAANQTSSMNKSDNNTVHAAGENGRPQPEAEGHSKSLVYAERHLSNGSSIGAKGDHDAQAFKSSDRIGGVHNDVSLGKEVDTVADDGKSLVKSDGAISTDNNEKATHSGPDVPAEKVRSRKATVNDSQERDARRHDKHESRSRSGRNSTKEIASSKGREDEKTESRSRRDERHRKKDLPEDYISSRERSKDQGSKHREKRRESDSRKRSPHHDVKDSKKERERDKKTSGKDDVDKKREKIKDEKDDKSRHKSSRDGGRHKRRRSSSVGSRGKHSKESPEVSDGSVGETSEDSRRKVHSRKRDSSPSPVRSRQRQVSRSPHSKRTQRRHSPYSSLDGSRERRSRSRSPVRRHR